MDLGQTALVDDVETQEQTSETSIKNLARLIGWREYLIIEERFFVHKKPVVFSPTQIVDKLEWYYSMLERGHFDETLDEEREEGLPKAWLNTAVYGLRKDGKAERLESYLKHHHYSKRFSKT